MAYYDALIAKWATLTGASASPASVSAARSALAAGPGMAQPTPPEGMAGNPPGPDTSAEQLAAWDAYMVEEDAYLAAQRTWHAAFSAPFYDPAVGTKLAALNAETVKGDVQSPVPINDLVDFLREQPSAAGSAWLAIKAAAGANPAAAAVLDLYEDARANTLDFSQPIVAATMTALVESSLVTQAQADAMEALSFVTVPWWESAGYASPIAETDLEAVFVATAGATALV